MSTMPYGVLALARTTFDVPYAEEMAAKAFAALDTARLKTIGPRELLFDAVAARKAAAQLKQHDLAGLLLLQVTFTDAGMAVELAKEIDAPVAIWAFPEPRLGGRLRLNSFCGLNLAAHALGRAGVSFNYLYQSPETRLAPRLVSEWARKKRALRGSSRGRIGSTAADTAKATAVLGGLKGRRIGLVGEHPAGFDTCRFDDKDLGGMTGITIDRIALGDLFRRAAGTAPARTAQRRREIDDLKGIDDVDQDQLAKSLTLFEGLASLKAENGLSAFAVRCWPEMFTEYGCAICGPMGMMNGEGVPAACEADVYGAVTALMLQEIAGAPSWLVDIVDMNAKDGTAVFWHCGSAPRQMRDPLYEAEAQIHSNRRMPLLYQFPLKPGRITIARLSQANNDPHMMVTAGEVIRAPISFTGTSGVVKLDGATSKNLHGLIGGAYEHHVAMVYGDHRGAMAALGRALGLPVRTLA
jgi:L-fucose isomerase-like protein